MRYSIIMCSLLLALTVQHASAQKSRRFSIPFDFSVGFVPLKLSGPDEVGNGFSTTINGFIINEKPVYQNRDTNLLVLSTVIHAGIDYAIFNKDTWSAGIKLFGGIGAHTGMESTDAFNSLVLDLPQYIYYRNKGSKFDYTLLAGYKFTRATINYHLIIAAVEWKFNEYMGFRLFCPLNSQVYYSYYTNDVLKPAIKIREFGIGYYFSFN